MHKLTFASRRKSSSFVGTGSNRSDHPIAEVDLVPMINVVFLLLIFFMVSAVFRTVVDAEIVLPNTEAQAVSTDQEAASLLLINAAGEYFVDGKQVTQEQLVDELRKMDFDEPLLLHADASSPAVNVATVLRLAAVVGIKKAGLQTINRTPEPTE